MADHGSGSVGADTPVNLRLRLSARQVAAIDGLIDDGQFRTRAQVMQAALSHYLSWEGGEERSLLQSAERTSSVTLFVSLILASRILTEIEREHVVDQARRAADEGVIEPEMFIEMMALNMSLEDRRRLDRDLE